MDTTDTLVTILEFMEPKEIIDTCTINKKFEEACNSELLWKKLYYKFFLSLNTQGRKIGTLYKSEYEKNYKAAFQEEVRRSNVRKFATNKIKIITQYAMLYLYSLNEKQLESVLNDSIALYGNNLLTLGRFKHRDYVISSLLKYNRILYTNIINIVKTLGKDEDNYSYNKLKRYGNISYLYDKTSDYHYTIGTDNIDVIYMILNEANKTSSNHNAYQKIMEVENDIEKYFKFYFSLR